MDCHVPNGLQARLLAQSVSTSDAHVLGKLSLVRAIYHQLRTRHPAPGLKWYITNMVVQVRETSLIINVTLLCRHASENVMLTLLCKLLRAF